VWRLHPGGSDISEWRLVPGGCVSVDELELVALLTTSCGLLALGLGLTSYIPDRSPV